MPTKAVSSCVLLFAVWISACEDPTENTNGDDDVFRADRVLNIAHRGGARLAPEATIAAFQNAVDIGVDVLELDVHATSDGVVVCMHDHEVDRTTDGTGFIREMTFDELRQLDAAHRFTTDGGETYPYRGTGLVVPSFGEVLDAFADQYFMVEVKQFEPYASIVDAVMSVIGEREMWHQVMVVSMSDAVVQEIRASYPLSVTGMGMAEGMELIFLDEHLAADYEPPALHFQAPAEFVSPELMAMANRFDVRIHAWTINEPDEMQAAIDVGVHGIITDDPAALEALLSD